MSHRGWVSLIVGLCLVLAQAVPTTTPQAAPGSRVLVLPFSASVQPDAPGGAGAALWLGEAAALLIADGLASLGFGALPREERVLAFDRLRLPMPAVLTRATMIRVGEIIGATEIVFGEVTLGPQLVVRAQTVHLGAARGLPDVTDEAPLADIFALFSRVAERIAGGALPNAPGGSFASPPLPLEVFENYVKGLVAATPSAQRRFLERALAEAPQDSRILTALWKAYSAEGDHEQALAAASAVPDADPGWRRSRFFLALSLIELRRLDGASEVLTDLLGQRATPAVANALGVIQLRQTPADARAAATYFAQAAEAEPGNTDYLFNRGYAHALAGDDDAALFWLRESVRFDAANGDSHAVMAAVLGSMGREPEARREWELGRLLGATALDGFLPGIQVPVGLERLQAILDLPGVARTEAALVNPAQHDQATTAAFHLGQARALLGDHREREAASQLRRAIYLAPYDDEPRLLLGGIYRRAGRVDEAIEQFTIAIWSRETAAARVALGGALLETGDRAAARREAERALTLEPGSTAARELLARTGGVSMARSIAVLPSGQRHD